MASDHDTDCLFVIHYDGDDGDCLAYITAPGLQEAITKWKEKVAAFINEDYASDGVERVITASEIDDPISVSLVAFPDELML